MALDEVGLIGSASWHGHEHAPAGRRVSRRRLRCPRKPRSPRTQRGVASRCGVVLLSLPGGQVSRDVCLAAGGIRDAATAGAVVLETSDFLTERFAVAGSPQTVLARIASVVTVPVTRSTARTAWSELQARRIERLWISLRIPDKRAFLERWNADVLPHLPGATG